MIDMIQQTGLSICITVVVIGMISTFVPSGKMERVFRYVMALFFLAAIILPFTDQRNFEAFDWENYRTSALENEQFSQSVADQTLLLVEQKLDAQIRYMLEQIDVSVQDVEFQLEVHANNNLSLARLTLTLHKDFRQKQLEISSVIAREFGQEPQYIYTDD